MADANFTVNVARIELAAKGPNSPVCSQKGRSNLASNIPQLNPWLPGKMYLCLRMPVEPTTASPDCLDACEEGTRRVIIENLMPCVDGGRFLAKHTIGDTVVVSADIFADGHDSISAVLKYRPVGEGSWMEVPMSPHVNDRWTGHFVVDQLGVYDFTVEAWISHFRTWLQDLEKRAAVGQVSRTDLAIGASILRSAATSARENPQRARLLQVADLLDAADADLTEQLASVKEPEFAAAVEVAYGRPDAVIFSPPVKVLVDPILARFSSWYELFPRSCSPVPGKHGTLRDCQSLLPRLESMGFDVLYLPPVHPIGTAFRKGRNNSVVCQPGDPGSPWAIGSSEGGHKAIHPELGTLEDFRELVVAAESAGIQIAMDIAFQCSPDHPYVKSNPQWFKHRPDGTIQYAENPPKKYQDIYPFDFETADWRSLWRELRSIFEFWMESGVRVFRVDNPHTKSFRFWEWCISTLKARNPELIFLSEAFTRPKVMYYLAKLGFTQSYNYFPWRNTTTELREYMTQLTNPPISYFFRPNLWPNTPDILPQNLQFGGRPAFTTRLILAATLAASYGVYGPPFEHYENTPREPGSEEYLNSEKYEIRHWDFTGQNAMADLMGRVNEIRRQNPALQRNENLLFHASDNPQILAFSKHTSGGDNVILSVVSLDPHHTQRGWLTLDLEQLGMPPNGVFQAEDLLTNSHYLWHSQSNYVELNPAFVPAHIFKLRRYVRTERQFDYFL